MGKGMIIGAIVGALTFGAGSAFFAKTFLASVLTGAALGNTVDSYNASKKMKEDAERARQDALHLSSTNTKTEDATVAVLYGTVRYGGNITFDSSVGQDKPKTIQLCIGIGEGEITAVRDVKINDKPIGSYPGCSYSVYLGGPYQGADSRNPDENYKNTAYLAVTVQSSEQLTGSPVVTAIVDGLKINVWHNGAWVYEFSRNPAWCLYNMMTNKRYGIGINPNRIDLQSFINEAAYCDELVDNLAGGTEPRYRLDAVLSDQTSAEDIISMMASNFRAFVVYTGGKYRLRIEKAEIPVQSFVEGENIISGSFKFYRASKYDVPNRLTVEYTDPVHWTSDTYTLDDDDDIALRGLFPKSLPMFGVTRRSQAARLCTFMFDAIYKTPTFVEWRAPIDAIECEAGDITLLTHSRGSFTDFPVRIISMSLEDNEEVSIIARQYDATVYSDDVRKWDPGTRIVVTDPLLNPPSIDYIEIYEDGFTNKDGTHVSNVYVTFSEPNYLYTRYYEVWYKYDNEDWVKAPDVTSTACTIQNVNTNKTIMVRVRLVNTLGRKAPFSESQPLMIIGKDSKPQPVSQINVHEIASGFMVSWKPNHEPDISGYDVYMGIGNPGLDKCEKLAENFAGTSMFVPVTAADIYGFYIMAVDNSGNRSDPMFTTAQFTLPPDVTHFIGTRNGAYIDFTWGAVATVGAQYEIRRGPSWDMSEMVCKASGTSYSYFFPVAGDHKFWIKCLDQYGNPCKNAMYTVTTMAALDRNAVKVIDKMVDNWQGTKINMSATPGVGLRMDDGVMRGEMLIDVDLPYQMLGRNIISAGLTDIPAQEPTWDSADFTWDDQEANMTWTPSIGNSTAAMQQYISRYVGVPESTIESIPLDESLLGELGALPYESVGVQYADGRFRKGVLVDDATKVGWDVEIPDVFRYMFYLRLSEGLKTSAMFSTLIGSDSDRLYIGYHAATSRFFVSDFNGNEVTLSLQFRDSDLITICVIQTATTRKIMAKSFSTGDAQVASQPFAPIGAFSKLALHIA